MRVEEMTIDELVDRFDELDAKCPIEDVPEYTAIALALARNFDIGGVTVAVVK